MKSSQRSHLSKRFKLASALTLLLSVASYQSIHVKAQAIQSSEYPNVAIESNDAMQVSGQISEAIATNTWQRQPVTLPIQASHIGLSQDGQRVIAIANRSTSATGGCLEVWSTQTGERLFGVPVEASQQFEATAISTDGSKVAAVVQDQNNNFSLWLWDIASDEPPIRESIVIAELPTDESVQTDTLTFTQVSTDVSFSPDGDKIVISARHPTNQTVTNPAQTLQLHSTETGKIIQVLSPTADTQIEQLTFSPDGEQLAGIGHTTSTDFAEASPIINIWQTTDAQLVSSFLPENVATEDGVLIRQNYIVAAAFTPTGQLKTLSNANLVSNQLITWELSTPVNASQIQTLPEVDRQDFIHALSPDGTYHFMRGDVGGTRLLNTQTLEVTQINERVSEAVFSADGDYLAITTPESLQIFSKAVIQPQSR